MRLDEPLQPEAVADLLVGCRDEDEIAGAAPSFARERGERHCVRSDLPLHVEGAAAPYFAVDELATERVALPLGRRGKHDVGVREQRERRAVAPAADAGDEVGALGRLRVELALDPRRLEVVAQHLCGGRLVAGRVRRVDANQPLQKLRDLGHLRLPTTSR